MTPVINSRVRLFADVQQWGPVTVTRAKLPCEHCKRATNAWELAPARRFEKIFHLSGECRNIQNPRKGVLQENLNGVDR